jgi:hypothetical protein
MTPKCADCDLELEYIRILDATQPGSATKGTGHVDLHYAPMSPEAGWFSGTAEGTAPITGKICPKCRRISMYG